MRYTKPLRAIAKLREFDFGIAGARLMGSPTLNVGTVHGGLNINSVPDRATIGVDIRTIPGQDHAASRSRMQRLLGETSKSMPTIDVEAIYSDPAEPWMQHVFAVTEPHRRRPGRRRTATYFTDAAVLNDVYRDVPMCVLGPGEPQLAHQTDEYLPGRSRRAIGRYLRRADHRNWSFVMGASEYAVGGRGRAPDRRRKIKSAGAGARLPRAHPRARSRSSGVGAYRWSSRRSRSARR